MNSEHKPTAQQQAFLDALLDSTAGHLCLRARAGTGKTSTILMATDAYARANPSHEILICAYNKAIADEVREKLHERGHGEWKQDPKTGRRIPPTVQAATAHALGLSTIKFLFKPEIDDKKVRKIVDRHTEGMNAPEERGVYQQYGAQIVQLVRYAKQAGFGFFPDCAINDVAAWHALADHFDVNGLDDTSEADAVVTAAQHVYRLSLEQTNVIDFDDMILFPLVKNVRVKWTKDLVFVDEAQDLSRARQALIRKFIGPRGRMVIVGDDRQCHPPGTKVYVTGRGYVPIERLQVGDEVLTYNNGYFPGKVAQGRKVLKIASRPYTGRLIKIKAGDKEHEVTPNHRCHVRMTAQAGSVVYVMQRGDHARVGRCTSKHGGDFGMAVRARQERADRAWAVRFFPAGQEDEAQLLEMLIAYKYGLPQTCFEYSWENGLSPTKRSRFWEQFPSNTNNMEHCLREYGLESELPFWRKDSGKHVGKYSFILTAANLHSDWMQVCLFDGNPHEPRWETVEVSSRSYQGGVWSLKVEPTQSGRHLYVANGIVTHNSIYGFSGADATAIDNQIQQFGAKVLPLSVTWRCPKKVVELAKTLVPDIEAAEASPEGEVLHIPATTTATGRHVAPPSAGKTNTLPQALDLNSIDFSEVEKRALLHAVEGNKTPIAAVSWYHLLEPKLGPTDAVLCRNTAPLISLAYQLIRAKIPCKVEGRAIGDGLKALAQRWKVSTVDALLKRLEAYAERERQKALAKGNETKAEEVGDRVATLQEICGACTAAGKHRVADVLAFIDDLFADGAENVVVLATYHRSKGREWPRVFLLEHASRCPSRAAKQAWAITQEHNLAYVAFTRAKKTLVFVG